MRMSMKEGGRLCMWDRISRKDVLYEGECIPYVMCEYVPRSAVQPSLIIAPYPCRTVCHSSHTRPVLTCADRPSIRGPACS